MPKNRLEDLARVLTGRTDVLILPHNDPDPDAIGAAVALQHLLKKIFQVKSQIVYRGYIGRAENKELVQYLGKPLRRINPADWLSESKIALVDTQPGVGNNALPEDCTADIVIDHHSLQIDTQKGQYVDIRPELGATSTILTDYLIEVGIEPTKKLATALFYGIKTDTMGLSRHASPDDVKAYFYLQPFIDVNALVQIEQAQVPKIYFQSIHNAIRSGRVFDRDIVIAYLGNIHYPDLCAEIADFFMRLEGIQWVLCMGVFNNELILSIRSRDKMIDAGKLVKEIIGKKGMAGGHGRMAAGHINLALGDDPERVADELKNNLLVTLKGNHNFPVKQVIGEK